MERNDVSKGISLAEFGIPSVNGNHFRLDANRTDVDRAAEYPALGWSSSARLFGAPHRQHLTPENFVITLLHGLDPTTRYDRQWGVVLISGCEFGRILDAEWKWGQGGPPREFVLPVLPIA